MSKYGDLPASGKQMNYIRGLIRNLAKLMPDGSPLISELLSTASEELNRADASQFIKVLIAAVERLRPTETASSEVDKARVRLVQDVFGAPAPHDLVPAASVVSEMRRSEDAWREDFHLKERAKEERERAYAEEQRRQFGGLSERPAPEGAKRYLKVWKRRPNALSEGWYDGVVYGWAWECTHPDHLQGRRGRLGKVIGGSATGGMKDSLASAMAHYRKFHGDDGA